MRKLIVWALFLTAYFTVGVILLSPPADAATGGVITYRFEGPHHGAFKDAKDTWNQMSRRTGAPQLVRAKDRPDFVIRGKKMRCSADTLGYFDDYSYGTDQLRVNNCYMRNSGKVARRQNYTHELGHALGLPHLGGSSVMREFTEDTEGWRPSNKDVGKLRRVWR